MPHCEHAAVCLTSPRTTVNSNEVVTALARTRKPYVPYGSAKFVALARSQLVRLIMFWRMAERSPSAGSL